MLASAGYQGVELAEQGDAEYNQDTALQAIDTHRTTFIKPRVVSELKDSIHGEQMAKLNKALRVKLASLTGAQMDQLETEKDTDKMLELSIGTLSENLKKDIGKDKQAWISERDELLKAHNANIQAKESEWIQKHSALEQQIQSQYVHAALAKLHKEAKGLPVAAVYASPLDRTMETARILAAPHQLEVHPREGLKEISHGHWEQLTRAEVEQKFPSEAAAWDEDPFTFAPEGGESLTALRERIQATTHRLAARHSGELIVLVAHGGVLDMIYRSATGQALGGPRQCLIPNAGLNHVRTDGQRFEIVAWAQTGHLEGLPASAVYPMAAPKA